MYLPCNITNNNVLCSWQVTIFSVCSHPWKPQYAQFSVITFIVVIGSFISCIQTIWMVQEKNHKETFSVGLFIFFMFCIYCIDWPAKRQEGSKSDWCRAWGEKKPWKWGWESPLCKWKATSLPNLFYAKMAIAFLNQTQGKTWFGWMKLSSNFFISPGMRLHQPYFQNFNWSENTKSSILYFRFSKHKLATIKNLIIFGFNMNELGLDFWITLILYHLDLTRLDFWIMLMWYILDFTWTNLD